MAEVVIGVQARTTSTRLPGKALELLEKRPMVERVLAACHSSADHVNRSTLKNGIHCDVALLIPEGDKLGDIFVDEIVIEGSEHDVLSRYTKLLDITKADYIVRVTGDCPLSSPPLITKHIMTAIKDELDYCSNVFEGCRTFIDGLDVEVISQKALLWLTRHAEGKDDREHVTTFFRRCPPEWAKIGTIIGHIDLSNLKLSVDTKQELEEVRENIRQVSDKITTARRLGHAIYRF